jgi:hypothetical protein
MTLAREFIFPHSLAEAFLENRTQGNECNDYRTINAPSPVGAPCGGRDSWADQAIKNNNIIVLFLCH